MKKLSSRITGMLAVCSLWLPIIPVFANIPGGGTGTGANVTLTDNGSTVTMANGIISIVITKSSAEIHTINYTWNNGGGTQTQQLLSGGKNGGMFYWEFGGFGSGSGNYSVVANNGNYAEVALFFNSATNGTVDVHFSMLRGSTGFYVTPIWSHRAQDGPQGTGEERDNIYFAPYFNWMSVNAQVDRETGLNATYAPAFYSPQENSLVTSGVLQGTYDDKYKWSADFGAERVWGWSSVSDASIGFTGKNIGLWHVLASTEFYNGGPLKPELNDAPMVNMINGGHYYFGNDSDFGNGEVWTRVSGPYFIYFNNVTNTLADPVQASRALFADAQAQAAAEAPAWPYIWMTNANYAAAAQRGLVTGQIVISDAFNPNASASNLWVGVVQQPVTVNNKYDFQLWMKPYQFWTKTDASGNFTIPNVIAGNNYTLYAFGPGAAGTFMSQNQNGGNPGLIYNLASPQFAVVVTGGATNNLGNVTWTPSRFGPTVFEIGYPDRKGDKFRHGDDYWVGDIGPSPTAPSPVWTKFMEFPFDFPNGLNYAVGQNRWNTDWNFIQSVYPDFSGNSIVSSSTVTFNLASNPGGATAALLLGIASDDNSPLLVTVNGTLLSSGNATGTPTTSLPTTGWFPINDSSDTNIREENHGGYSDERLTFSGNLLHSGNNTINFSFRQAGGSGFSHHFIYDFIRLELTGYVPPAPAGVTAYAGNNSVLLSWPAVAGATSYNLLRSTTSGSGYVSVTNGVTGPVCGSGPANAIFVDSTAANGTTYYYVVQSVNPVNASGNSPPSSGVTPSAGIATDAPATPAGLIVTSTNNAVTFIWNAVPGANFYTVYRGTVVNRIGSVPFYTILSDTMTSPTCTDASGTLGCTYSYFVTATSAVGTSSNSIAITAKPVPPPPAGAPANMKVADTFTTTNQSAFITWSPVSGAVGYILYRSTSPAGPFNFPGNYMQSMMTTNFSDDNLARNTQFYYTVVAMNAGGVSGNSTIAGTPPAPPAAPASLSAVAGDAQVTLNWPAVPGATGYYLFRGTSSGNETTTVVANYSGTSHTNTGLANGTTYYFVVDATNAGGLGPDSPEASATPGGGIVITPQNLVWRGDGVANVWDVSGTATWQSNGIVTVFNNGDSVSFDDTGSNNISVALTGTLQPALITFNAAKNYTFGGTGLIGGTNALSKSGAGTLTLTNTGNDSFTGGVAITGGILALGTDSGKNEKDLALGTGPVLVSTNGQLRLGGDGGGAQVQHFITNAITLDGGTIFGVDGDQHFTNSTFNVTAGGGTFLNRWSGKDIFIESPLTGNGPLIVNYGGGGSLGSDVYFGNPLNTYNGTISVLANAVALTSPYALASAVVNASGTGANLVWSGVTSIVLGGLGGAGSIALGANQLTVGQSGTSTIYSGALSGTGSLVKTGAGAFTLAGANAHTGATIVSNGTLLVNGSLNGSPVTVNGGTLGGTGIISAPVTVNSGGAFAPGNPPGNLMISNNLTLNSGSTTFVQVQHSPLTNDAVIISGTLFEGGTLTVTNIGGALSGGDSFKLFSAANYSGSFAGFILPPLTGNLAWNTNLLKNSGVLSVVALTPPNIAGIQIVGGNLMLNGSGGAANWPFLLLAATNLTSAQWTPVTTNQFDAGGGFNLTNVISPYAPQTFYRLQLQ